MPKFNKLNMSIAESRYIENMRADIARNKAINDYIAMMCDVEIPEPERPDEEVRFDV